MSTNENDARYGTGVEQSEYEVTALTETDGLDVFTVEASSEEEAESKVLDMDDVYAIREGLTVGFDRDEDGRRVY